MPPPTRILASALRIACAAALLLVLVQDWPATRAVAELAALPDHDHAAEAERLMADGRLDEAELVIDAGLSEADDADRAALLAQRARLGARRASWQYRAGELAQGAWTGRGDSTTALVGAVTADLLVFGDVRDLVMASADGLRGRPVDPVIVALSGAGLALTVWPGADAGTAVLKLARRSGALGGTLARQLVRASRRAVTRRDPAPVQGMLRDAATLQRAGGTVPAMRTLRHVRDRGDLARAARFGVGRSSGYVLWAGGADALRALRIGGADAGRWLHRAARKGPDGIALVARNARVLARPHPLIGLTKGIYKGNAGALLSDALRCLGAPLIGLVAGWLLFELGRGALLLRGPGRRRDAVV